MKNKLLPLLCFALSFSACGKLELESDKKKNNLKPSSSVIVNPLSPQEFAAACAKQGGAQITSSICAYVSRTELLNGGMAGSSTDLKDLTLGTLPAGAAVFTQGNAPNNSVEVVVDGVRLTGIPNNNPVRSPSGGALAFRLRPGNYSSVQLSIYVCLAQNMQPTQCPY